ncbi:MAG: hypothetical protein ACI9NG_001989, partial [Hyphomonas sp.]
HHRLEAFNRAKHSLRLFQNAADRMGINEYIRYR